jgi:hypothetical protein
MNPTIPMLAITLSGCAVLTIEEIDSAAPPEDTSVTEDDAEMSECGQQVLRDDSWAYEACFTGDETFGACETCGYYSSEEEAQRAFGCITCPPDYEIDVVFGDCTGYCVPEGTATYPVSKDECLPVSVCVYYE